MDLKILSKQCKNLLFKLSHESFSALNNNDELGAFCGALADSLLVFKVWIVHPDVALTVGTRAKPRLGNLHLYLAVTNAALCLDSALWCRAT